MEFQAVNMGEQCEVAIKKVDEKTLENGLLSKLVIGHGMVKLYIFINSNTILLLVYAISLSFYHRR